MTTVLIVLAAYMVLMVVVGLIFSKKASSVDGYYLSNRSLPTYVLVFTFAATWIGASATLGKSGLAYTSGLSAISPTLGTFVAFFIFSFFAGRIRKIGADYNIKSIPELFYKRFGAATSVICALVIAWTLIGTTGAQLVAFSKILKYIFSPYGISYEQALIIGMVIVVAYTVLSGMYGVAYTDVLQGLILLIVIGFIVPFSALSKAGGWTNLKAQVDPSFFSLKPSMSMIGYTVTSFLYFVAGPPYWQRAFAAKSDKAAGRGAFGGNLLIIYYTLAVILCGICACVVFPNVPASDTEMVLLMMVESAFPAIIYSITVAAIVAVIMSTTDSYLILSAQTITTDIITVLFGEKDQKKTIIITRVSVVIVGIFSLLYALKMNNIFESLMLSMTQFAAAVAVPALFALFSRKVTKEAMISAMLSGLISSILWNKVLHNPWGLSESISGSIVSLIVIIVVSAITQKKQPAPFLE